jgi:hypothetical protein
MPASRLDRPPVGVGPLRHLGEWCVESPAEVSQFVQRGRLDPAGIETTRHEPVALGPAERLSQHLVRDAIHGVMELLVAATPVR